MGPAIILDKSAFQFLSAVELHFLYKYYYVVITPILILEILGDLAKEESTEESKQKVTILANKFGVSSSSRVAPREYIMAQELMGASR